VEIRKEKREVNKRRRREEKKGKRKWKGENMRKNKNKRKVKGIMDISPPYPHYTAKRSCFAKCFPKTDSAESAPPAQL
jgi:hypothetical protein